MTAERSATSEAIEAELLEIAAGYTDDRLRRELARYGMVGKVPHGTGAALARKHGVSRERVRQIASRARIESARLISRYRCRRCRRHTRAAGKVCGDCIEVRRPAPVEALRCDGCGVTFERERRKVRANAKQAAGRGRAPQVFCTPACAGRTFHARLTASATGR